MSAAPTTGLSPLSAATPDTDAPQQAPPTLFQRLRRMTRGYFFQTLLQGLLTIWAVTTFTFFLIRLMPGSPFEVLTERYIRQGMNYEDAYRAAAALLDFDPNKPVLLQYGDFIGGLLKADLGKSITRGGTPVLDIILTYLPWTLFCVGLALIISFTLGILLGLAMGYWRGSWLDNLITSLASVISGIPDYVMALLIVLIFGVQLGWFKVGQMRGGVDPTITPGFTAEYIGSVLQYASLPILIYVLSTIGTWILAMKSSTISTLGEDYITVAQARGLSPRRVLMTYIGRNAMLPLITRLAINVGLVVGGSVIIEQLFLYPGLGNNLYLAITGRDYTIMQGIFLVITIAVVLSNIFADLAIGWLDPRVRVEKKENS